jgi:hypothetical protein
MPTRTKKPKTKNTVTFYVCGVNWMYHLGQTETETHPSFSHLKQKMKCADECGIVKITIPRSAGKWIRNGKLLD